MVLGKLPVTGRPTYLDNSRARAYCVFSRCGWDSLDFYSLVSRLKPKETNHGIFISAETLIMILT